MLDGVGRTERQAMAAETQMKLSCAGTTSKWKTMHDYRESTNGPWLEIRHVMKIDWANAVVPRRIDEHCGNKEIVHYDAKEKNKR